MKSADKTRSANITKVVVLEFVGLPGVGKSTIMTAWQNRAPSGVLFAGSSVKYFRGGGHERLSFLFSALASITLHPILHARLLLFGLRTGGLSRFLFLQTRRVGQLIYDLDQLKAACPPAIQIVVLDQGVIQFIGSLSIPGKGNELPLIRDVALRVSAGRVDGVIHVAAEKSVSLQRLRARAHGKSRFDHDGGGMNVNAYERFEQVLLAAIDAYREKGKPVLVLNGLLPPDENVDRIEPWLDELKTTFRDAG